MVGILIATHGEFSKGLLNAVELIMGKQKDIATMSLYHGTDIGEFGNEMKDKIAQLDGGDGVLVFVDLYAASPCNQAVLKKKELENVNYKVITGVNLTMLLEGLAMRNISTDLETMCVACMAAGREGIKEFFEEFGDYNK